MAKQPNQVLILSDPNAIVNASSLTMTYGTVQLLSDTSTAFNGRTSVAGGNNSASIYVGSLSGSTSGQTLTFGGGTASAAAPGSKGSTLSAPTATLWICPR